MRREVLASFRRLMRARELAFRGDTEMLRESRVVVRQQFVSNRNIPSEQILGCIQGADEATDMLKHQLVQGVRTGEGSYSLNVDQRHAQSMGGSSKSPLTEVGPGK